MHKTILKLFTGLMLLIATQACTFPSTATSYPNPVKTAAAAASQTSQPGIPVTGNESPTPTTTAAPTSTAIGLPSPASTSAATPGVPQVSVSVATNCRTGPGIAYDQVGVLHPGQAAEVTGRDPARNYWVIRNPERSGELCWLWGQFATVQGNIDALPQVTPPPSPTATITPSPAFDASFSGLERCTGTGWWVEVDVRNTGTTTFRSLALTVTDTVTHTVVSLYAENFTDRKGCNQSESRDTITPGNIRTVSSPAFSYDPTGHPLNATITVCSDPGQNGICATKTIRFTP